MHDAKPALTKKPDGTLALSGLVCFETVVSVYQQGLRLLDEQPTDMMIDLKAAQHKDSSILALLSAWIRYTMTQAKRIHFIEVSTPLQHLLQLSGLEKIVLRKRGD